MSDRSPAAVPTLETERLILLAHTTADFDDCAALWSDPRVTEFIGGRPFSREETWTRMLRYAGLWPMLGFGYWAVREKGTGRFVGDVGFADYRRSIVPSIAGKPEIGWVLAPWCHGLGYATEAVQAVLGWSDGRRAGGTVCIIVPEHRRSIRLAEKVGYREAGPATYNGHAMTIFTRPDRPTA